MNPRDLESDFSGESTDTLTVTETTSYASPDAVPTAVAPLLVQQFGKYAGQPTLPAVFALTDERLFTNYCCTVAATGDVVDIVTTHMGDTFVGIAVHGGKRVAELNDGYLWPVS